MPAVPIGICQLRPGIVDKRLTWDRNTLRRYELLVSTPLCLTLFPNDMILPLQRFRAHHRLAIRLVQDGHGAKDELPACRKAARNGCWLWKTTRCTCLGRSGFRWTCALNMRHISATSLPWAIRSGIQQAGSHHALQECAFQLFHLCGSGWSA